MGLTVATVRKGVKHRLAIKIASLGLVLWLHPKQSPRNAVSIGDFIPVLVSTDTSEVEAVLELLVVGAQFFDFASTMSVPVLLCA
jgi:hypothetical protein